jgi:hypothetical protein
MRWIWEGLTVDVGLGAFKWHCEGYTTMQHELNGLKQTEIIGQKIDDKVTENASQERWESKGKRRRVKEEGKKKRGNIHSFYRI